MASFQHWHSISRLHIQSFRYQQALVHVSLDNMSLEVEPKIILVTGANQGLGLAVIEVAGRRSPQDIFILCSRDVEKGQKASKQLQEAGVNVRIDIVQLEVTNNDDIVAAVKHVQKNYGRLDGESSYTLVPDPKSCTKSPFHG